MDKLRDRGCCTLLLIPIADGPAFPRNEMEASHHQYLVMSAPAGLAKVPEPLNVNIEMRACTTWPIRKCVIVRGIRLIVKDITCACYGERTPHELCTGSMGDVSVVIDEAGLISCATGVSVDLKTTIGSALADKVHSAQELVGLPNIP